MICITEGQGESGNIVAKAQNSTRKNRFPCSIRKPAHYPLGIPYLCPQVPLTFYIPHPQTVPPHNCVHLRAMNASLCRQRIWAESCLNLAEMRESKKTQVFSTALAKENRRLPILSLALWNQRRHPI